MKSLSPIPFGVRMVDNLGPYLGLPSAFMRRKTEDWTFLKNKVWKVMQGWKRSFFSGPEKIF